VVWFFLLAGGYSSYTPAPYCSNPCMSSFQIHKGEHAMFQIRLSTQTHGRTLGFNRHHQIR